jgi:hypothetical protein
VSLSDQEIRNAASHLNYEVKAMAELCAWTRRLEETKGPAALWNACLEATYVHLRVLIEFVAGRPRQGDEPRGWSEKDIGPRLFVSDWPGLPDGQLDRYRELADQYIAHLSLIRAHTVAILPPPLDVMVDAVLVELERFTKAAEEAGSPAAAALRDGLRDAARFRTRPGEPWPLTDPS